jgi:1,4-dihydroxy-2-naphthoyl-CoA hydrolase
MEPFDVGAADPIPTDSLLAAMPFAVACGVELVRAEPAEVEGTLAWAPERCTTGGVMHGAALVALADSVGGICAFLNLPAGAGTSTIESKTNFFRAVRRGTARAVARPGARRPVDDRRPDRGSR